MLAFYIDKEPEYIDFSIADDDYITANFAIFGNRDFNDYRDAEWIKKVDDILSDLDNDFYTGESLKDYSELTRTQRKAILAIYENARNTDDADTIADVLNIIYPDKRFVSSTIRGCCQNEWQNVICEKSDADYLNNLADLYFGYCAEVHFEDDDGETCYATVTNTELWENRDNLKDFVRSLFDFTAETPCELYESDGYTTTKSWKVA